MNIVSSPEIVPITSGQRAVSIATATRCAEPTVVLSTVRLVPEVRTALTNCLSVEKSFFTAAELGHAELAQVQAHARLGCRVAELLQHRDQLGLAPDRLLANDFRERRAARRGIGIVGVSSEHSGPQRPWCCIKSRELCIKMHAPSMRSWEILVGYADDAGNHRNRDCSKA